MSSIPEVPSLDEQNGNMPGLAAYDPGFEEWLDEHQQPITAEEDEMAYRQWQLEQLVEASRSPIRIGYHMVALKGKDKGWFEIRRDSDGEWIACIRGRAEAKRELAKYNGAA